MINNSLILIPIKSTQIVTQHGILGIGMRCMLSNTRSLSTLMTMNKPTEYATKKLYFKDSVRSYHNSGHRKDYDFTYPNRQRWYDTNNSDIPMHEKFNEMQHYQQYMKHQRNCNSVSKFKFFGGVIGGLFILSHIPTLITIALGGALGMAAYRWMGAGQRYKDQIMHFQYPDTSSIFKQVFKDPKMMKHFMNQNLNSYNQQPNTVPDFKSIYWSMFHNWFPNVGDKAIVMQNNVGKLRDRVIAQVRKQIQLEDNELLKYVQQLIAHNNPNPLFDSKLLSFEPYCDVKYINNNVIHIELLAKYPSNQFGVEDHKFLIYAEGNVVENSDVALTKASIVCLKSWKAIPVLLD